MTVRKKRGIVLEIKDSQMFLLTPEGEFVCRPILDNIVILGQEICYTENVEVCVPPRRKLLDGWRRSGLAVAVVLVLLVLTPALLNYLPFTSETVAYITLDVNPSLELEVDNNNKIVSVAGLNEEGKLVADLLDLMGKQSEFALEILTRKIVELGYIKPQEFTRLMITVWPVKPGNPQVAELERKLAAVTKETLAKDNVKYTFVQTALINDELRVSAQTAGVSPGRYLIMLNDNYLAGNWEKNIYEAQGIKDSGENSSVVLEDKPIPAIIEPEESGKGSKNDQIAMATPPETGTNQDEIGKTGQEDKINSGTGEEPNVIASIDEVDDGTKLDDLFREYEAGKINLEELLEMAAKLEVGEKELDEIMASREHEEVTTDNDQVSDPDLVDKE